MPPAFLTIREAADLLRVSESTIQRYRASGKLAFQKLGVNGVRFRRELVLALLEPGAAEEPAKSWTRDAQELPRVFLRPIRRAVA
jgi:excisionase family DNA binding protein